MSCLVGLAVMESRRPRATERDVTTRDESREDPMTRPKRTALALAMTLLTLAPFGSLTVSPAAAAPLLTLPIAGATPGNGSFSGSLAVTSVVAQWAAAFVAALLTGTVAHSNKHPLGTVLSVRVGLP